MTKQDVIEGVKKQLERHPDCMNSHGKWLLYEDRPFCLERIYEYLGWKKAKELFGIGKIPIYNRRSDNEIINGIKNQFQKHPDCMNSRDMWDSYKDKPFSSAVIRRFGWKKAKDMVGKKYMERGWSDNNIILGIKNQCQKHPDCMDSPDKWNSYEDRPFCSNVINRFGWRKSKKIMNLTCMIRQYSTKDIIESVSSQFQKHPDCMDSPDKWNSYEDRPFHSGLIDRSGVRWRKLKEKLGLRCTYQNYCLQEVISMALEQFQKHPDCMDSPDKWNSYEDRPISVGVIFKYGWTKIKVMMSIPVDAVSTMYFLKPLIMVHKSEGDWLKDIFELVSHKAHDTNHRCYLERKMKVIADSPQTYSKEDIALAKKCLQNLRDEWKRSNKIS